MIKYGLYLFDTNLLLFMSAVADTEIMNSLFSYDL